MVDTFLDDGETLLTSASLFFDVTLEEFFFLPDGIRGAFDYFFARLGNVGEPFLQKLLSLGDLLLPLVELLGLVLPLGVEEVNDVGQLSINIVKLALRLIKYLLKDVL